MSMTTTKNHRIVILSGLFAAVAFVCLFATSAVGSELVANSTSIAAWRPWEITHARTRTVYEET